MSDEQILAEPVFDEFTLSKLAEAAEYQDQIQKAKAELRQIRAEAEERDRAQAEAQFAEARRLHPHLSVHQIAGAHVAIHVFSRQPIKPHIVFNNLDR